MDKRGRRVDDEPNRFGDRVSPLPKALFVVLKRRLSARPFRFHVDLYRVAYDL